MCALAAKKKAKRQHVDLIVKVFKENLETSFPGEEYRMPIKDPQRVGGLNESGWLWKEGRKVRIFEFFYGRHK